MNSVQIRRWSDRVLAIYVDLGEKYPTFVGTECTPERAEIWAEFVLSDPDGCSKRRCGAKDSGRVLSLSEHLSVRQLRGESDGPECLITPARLAPDTAGATP